MEQVKNLEIVKYPADILRKKSIDIKYSEEVKQIAIRMLSLMKDNNGIGLAANQVGLDWRMFVMKISDKDNAKICINPEIIYGCVPYTEKEACLSEPGISVEVTRNKYIVITYIDIDGKIIKENMKDLEARCAQHEIDHLNGIMISDHSHT